MFWFQKYTVEKLRIGQMNNVNKPNFNIFKNMLVRKIFDFPR
jgi:hypothetical protein